LRASTISGTVIPCIYFISEIITSKLIKISMVFDKYTKHLASNFRGENINNLIYSIIHIYILSNIFDNYL
jgi:Na+/H+ antiporter NhaD/arsenite permease-like protein